MEVIRDKYGNPIKTSRNLRGIREYVSDHIIKFLAIHRIARGRGKLEILFEDKSSYETNFESYIVLKDFVRKWRNVYGSPLIVNGEEAGEVGFYNLDLSPKYS